MRKFKLDCMYVCVLDTFLYWNGILDLLENKNIDIKLNRVYFSLHVLIVFIYADSFRFRVLVF